MPRSLERSSSARATSFFGGRGWGLDIRFLGRPAVSSERRPAQSTPEMLLRAMPRVVRLATPPALRLVPDGVFDAYGWCGSDELEGGPPAGTWDDATPIDGSDPARMVFVTRP